MKKVISILLLGLAAAFILPAQATPTPISTTMSLDTVYAGYTPDGSAPWLTATFTSEVGSSTGTLTLTSHLSSGDFVQGANGVTGWGFYLDSATFPFTITSCTGTCPDTTWQYSIGQQGPVPGTFNLGFGWVSGNRFNAGDTATFNISFTGESGLQGSPFLFNEYGINSYSHIQGISGNPTCSGYVISENGNTNIPTSGLYGSCSATNVPEPNDLGMFGIGVLLIGIFLGLNRRRLFS